MIEKAPFVPYKLEEERAEEKGKIMSVRLNDDELRQLEKDAKILQQEKPATALKQLARIGSYVIHEQKTAYLIDVLFNNERRNKRIGIDTAIPDFQRK